MTLFVFFSSQFSFNIVFCFLNRCREKEALRKRRVRQQFRGRWKRRKLKKWDRLYSGVSFLIVAFICGFLLPSVTVTWFSCSEKSMMGERSPLSGSPLILCISSSFPFVFIVSLGAGLCVVEWRVGARSLHTGTLLSSQRASGSTTHKRANKQTQNQHQSLAVTKGEKITFQKKKIYTCTLSPFAKYYLRNKDR